MTTSDSGDGTEKETESGERAANSTGRRASRTSKRKTTRSTALKRKTPAAETEKPAAPEPAARPTPAKKPAVKKTTARARAKPAAKKVQPRAARPKPKEEEYQLKTLPDGTQFKVKISDIQKKPKKVARRKISGGAGPGPALIGMEGTVEEERPDRQVDVSSIIEETKRSVSFLKRRVKEKPKVGVILGSGLSPVAELADDAPIPFSRIPGFARTTVDGHPGRVRAGVVEGVPVVFCEGRLHYYETGSMAETAYQVRALMALGVKKLILTTSAGALNLSFRAGEVMMVTDHINLMGDNPLFGRKIDADMSLFTDVSEMYDAEIISGAERLFRRARVKMRTGVLAGVRGPVYETAAEREMLRIAGADAVCMSVIPEALAAAHVGVKVTALALLANDGSAAGETRLTHSHVTRVAQDNAAAMKRLISMLIGEMK